MKVQIGEEKIEMQRGNDGYWLHVKHGGKYASVNIPRREGGIITEVFDAIAEDIRSRKEQP